MKKQIIITIHGIRTRQIKSWQMSFWNFVKSNNPDVKVFRYQYGFLMAPMSWWFAFTSKFRVLSFFRKRIISGFVKFINKIQRKFPDHEINIIAHSFGTWISYYSLERDPDIRVGSLVLVQGVISSHIEKLNLANWLELGRVKRVHAWSSPNDRVVGKLVLPPFGKLGYRGFIRRGHDEDRINPAYKPYPVEIYNHRTDEGHGGVLDKLDVYGEELLAQLIKNKKILR